MWKDIKALKGGYFMKLELGGLCQVAGAAIGTYFCPGLGTAIGSAAGKAVGDAIDGKDKDKKESKDNSLAQNNSIFDLSNLEGSLGSSLNISDATKLISIFGV